MADFFDKEDVVQPTTAPKSNFFDESDVVSTQPPIPSQVAKPEEPPTPESLKDEDFQRIGSKYGVDPSTLKQVAPYYGVQTQPKTLGEAVSTGAKAAAGFAGQAALGIPQFVYKKLQDEPTRKALDELRDIGRKQTGYIQTAAEMVSAPAGLVGKTGGALARVGEAAGLGGVYGLTGSKEGEETKAAATGAALGGALGVGAESIGALLAKKYKPNQLEEQLFENQSASKKFDLEKGINDIADRTKDSEKMMEEIGFGGKDTLSRPEVDTLVKQQIGDESLAKYLDPATEEGVLIRKRMEGPKTAEAIKEQLANDIIENRARGFAEDITGTRPKDAPQAFQDIEEYASRQGTEAVRNKYKDFLRLEQAEKHINESGIRATDDPNFFGKSMNFMSDNQFVFRHLDDKYGTRLEDTIRALNKDYNRSTFALREFRNGYDDVFRKARANGTDKEVVNTTKIYDALDKGDVSKLSPQELETAKGFKQYFDNILDYVNGLVKEKDPRIAPLSIPKRENYVPKMLKSTPDLIGALESKLELATDEISAKVGRQINDLAQLNSQEYKALVGTQSGSELLKALGILDNNVPKSGAELSSALKEMMYSRDGNIALESAARAAMERKGEIPDFMVEKNLYKLARRYTDNTLRHLYLRNGIDKLRYQAKALHKAGADVEAKYTENLIKDILGVRKGTANEAVLQGKVKLTRTLDKLIDTYGKDSTKGAMLTFAKGIPEWLQFVTRQIYPNVLGYFNVRAAIQNATSGITKLAPELGTKYGMATVLRGGIHAVGNWSRLLEKVKSSGAMPAEFTRKGEQAIAEGIARSSLFQLPKEVLEGAGKAGMIMFEKTEQFNRALTMGTAEVMARDIARGSNLALGSLSKFPLSIRQAVLKNRSNPEVTGEILGKYLNDVTQYNYNKISMSEFGRTMGPFFSTFSKWPTATAGDVIHEMRDKGLLKSIPRNFEKYVAPWILLQAIDYAIGERRGDKDSLSDVQKKLVGSNGLSQSAPLGSLGAIAKGEIFTPPAVDAIMQSVFVPIMEGDTAKLEKGVGSAVNNFTPFAGLIRFITDDLVTYVTGERPEGSNFLERTKEGAERIVK